MEYVDEYRKTLEEVKQLEDQEELEFMWNVQELLDESFQQVGSEGKQTYSHVYRLLEDSSDTDELAVSTRKLHDNFVQVGTLKPEYVQDVVNGVYRKALDRTQ